MAFSKIWLLTPNGDYQEYTVVIPPTVCPHCGLLTDASGACGCYLIPEVPTQETFFDPPDSPPFAVAWRIEWRRKPSDKVNRWYARSHEDVPKDWTPFNNYEITSHRTALNAAQNKRRLYPEASFRVIPVRWKDDTPPLNLPCNLPPPFPPLPGLPDPEF